VCRRESHPLVGKCPWVKVQPLIPILQSHLAGYFSRAVLWEMIASMSAKPTQFSFPLCCSFPVVSSKSYIATQYCLNIQFAPFCQPGVVLFQGANKLNGLTGIIYAGDAYISDYPWFSILSVRVRVGSGCTVLLLVF